MSLLFFDGFETYGLGVSSFDEMRDVYMHDDVSDLVGALITVQSSDRIPSGQLLNIHHNVQDNDRSTTRTMRFPLAGLTSQETLIVGTAIRAPDGLNGDTAYNTIFGFASIDNEGMIELRLRGNGDLRLDFLNIPDPTDPVDEYVSAITDTDWHYIEIKITFHGSAGTYDVRLDGTSVMNTVISGPVKTNNSSNNRPGVIVFGHVQNKDWQYDDWYIMDDLGAAPTNDFLNGSTVVGGDIFVQRVKPNAAGESADFTDFPAAGANYLDVEEDAEDGDNTYVESKTATNKDLYNYQDLDPFRVGTIFGVVAKPVVRKTDAGSRTYKLIAKSGGNEVDSGTRYPSVTYVRQTYIWTLDPQGAGTEAWTATSFNAAQFGLEIVA
jgi:hypothetical protein